MKILHYLASTLPLNTVDVENLPTGDTDAILSGALNLVYFAAGAAAVIVIVIAGYTFATTAGDAAKVAKARNTILFAVIGLVVVIAAFIITQFVLGRF